MNSEFPMWSNVKNVNNKKHNFIIIGDSRAKAGFKPDIFDYDNIDSINLAVSGGTPIEGYFTLLNYLKNNEKPEYLLISYAPFHLVLQDCFWKRTVRFDFLSDNILRDIINNAENIEVDNKTLGNQEKLIYYRLITSKYFIEFTNGMIHRRWIKNNEILERLEKSKGHSTFGAADFSDALNVEANFKNFIPSKLIDYYFEKMLKLANDNRITIYYYTMPFNESSFSIMNDDVKIEYENYIRTLSKKYNLKILNELNFLDNSNFGDASHLYNGIDKVSLDIRNKFKNSLE